MATTSLFFDKIKPSPHYNLIFKTAAAFSVLISQFIFLGQTVMQNNHEHPSIPVVVQSKPNKIVPCWELRQANSGCQFPHNIEIKNSAGIVVTKTFVADDFQSKQNEVSYHKVPSCIRACVVIADSYFIIFLFLVRLRETI